MNILKANRMMAVNGLVAAWQAGHATRAVTVATVGETTAVRFRFLDVGPTISQVRSTGIRGSGALEQRHRHCQATYLAKYKPIGMVLGSFDSP